MGPLVLALDTHLVVGLPLGTRALCRMASLRNWLALSISPLSVVQLEVAIVWLVRDWFHCSSDYAIVGGNGECVRHIDYREPLETLDMEEGDSLSWLRIWNGSIGHYVSSSTRILDVIPSTLSGW